MKILFLDIDGVLNDHTRHPTLRYCSIDKANAERLNQVLWATGAKVVMSSAWRYLALMGSMELEGLQNLLLSHWVDGARVIGVTARDEMLSTRTREGEPLEYPKPEQRGERIREWLADQDYEVDRWVVVDDERNCFTEQDRRTMPIHFTDGSVGLTDSDVERLIELLGREPSVTPTPPGD